MPLTHVACKPLYNSADGPSPTPKSPPLKPTPGTWSLGSAGRSGRSSVTSPAASGPQTPQSPPTTPVASISTSRRGETPQSGPNPNLNPSPSSSSNPEPSRRRRDGRRGSGLAMTLGLAPTSTLELAMLAVEGGEDEIFELSFGSLKEVRVRDELGLGSGLGLCSNRSPPSLHTESLTAYPLTAHIPHHPSSHRPHPESPHRPRWTLLPRQDTRNTHMHPCTYAYLHA